MAGSTCCAAMHETIAERSVADMPQRDWRVIHLGDYVDRGPESKGVIDFLIAARKRDRAHLTLAGNHDIGFLEFLGAPERGRAVRPLWRRRDGAILWRRHSISGTPDGLREGHAALLDAVPHSHFDFSAASAGILADSAISSSATPASGRDVPLEDQDRRTT